MPAKEVQIKLKPKIKTSDFLKNLDENLILEGTLKGLSRGDVVSINRRGLFFWDGNTLIKGMIDDFSKLPITPVEFLTFDEFPIGHWKHADMYVKPERFTYIKSFKTNYANQPYFLEYEMKGNGNQKYKVLLDYKIIIDKINPYLVVIKKPKVMEDSDISMLDENQKKNYLRQLSYDFIGYATVNQK